MRINWPGKISIIHVNDMAAFIYAVSEKQPTPSSCEVYIPSIEAITLQDMSKIVHNVLGVDYKEFRLPNFFWNICRFFARNKNVIEYIMPHKLYDRFWQACLLVNNEFWNQSPKIYSVIDGWKPMKYAEYFNQKNKK